MGRDGTDRDSLTRLLETLPVGVERIDTAGRILYSNAQHHRMLGYSPGELTGRLISDFVVGEDRAEDLRRTLALLAAEQPEPKPWFGENRRKDGSSFDMRVDWTYDRDDDGRLVGFVAALTDISDQRAAERERDRTLHALQDHRRHMASLLHSAVDFVLYRLAVASDNPHAAEVVFVSPSIRDVMGVDAPEDFSSWFKDIVPDDRERVTRANRTSAETGSAFDEVMRIRHPILEEVRWIRAISRPVLDDRGVPSHFNGLLLDVTAAKRAEEERLGFELKLHQHQRLESIGVLAGAIAHDFNNLLVGMLGSADLALERLPEESPARKHVGNAVGAAQHAAELTQQLLAYSGHGTFEVHPISLNGIVRGMTDILRPAISKLARLDLELAADLPDVHADGGQIGQVVMNLVMNASDALYGEPGEIRIVTSVEWIAASELREHVPSSSVVSGHHVRLDVSDTGCGMSAETSSRIFDPFYTTKTHGRGLGLAMVRGIVRGHRGAIRIDSELGGGTTVSLLLPAAKSEAKGPPAAAEGRAERPARRTVLIIDDNELVRSVAADMLATQGHVTLTATDGVEGLEVLTAHRDEVDAILLDMNMPQMNGATTFAGIREIRDDVRVIFSSGFQEQAMTELLDGTSRTDFIQKPYRLATLLKKLELPDG